MSLYQRGKSWYYDFRHRGERYAGCIGPVSKTVAKEILAKKKAEAVEGRYEMPSKKPSPRLEEFVQDYFAYYRTNRRPLSVTRHEASWRIIKPVFGTKRLTEISSFDLERYRRQRKQTGVSDVTINRELTFLRHVFNMAIKWGKATENPVAQVKFAREDNGRTRFLTPDEESRLLAHCSPQLKPLVITALHTGFRGAELLSLTWKEVDFHRRIITVQAAYVKNGESRSVPMNTVLIDTLKTYSMHAVAPDSPVFCYRPGIPYWGFRTAFASAVKRAGLVDVTFHDLRHTFASRLVMAGIDLPTVKELMGHKTITMTLRYAHLSTGHKQRAVSALEQFGEKVPAIFPTVASLAQSESTQPLEDAS